jgi:hypothetical protein
MAARRLRFHVNPGHTTVDVRFELDAVDGETVADLKARVSAEVGPHQAFFVLRMDERPLALALPVSDLFAGDGGDEPSIVVAWSTCSHGAPMHPITGASTCFWDGGEPQGVVEY